MGGLAHGGLGCICVGRLQAAHLSSSGTAPGKQRIVPESESCLYHVGLGDPGKVTLPL